LDDVDFFANLRVTQRCADGERTVLVSRKVGKRQPKADARVARARDLPFRRDIAVTSVIADTPFDECATSSARDATLLSATHAAHRGGSRAGIIEVQPFCGE